MRPTGWQVVYSTDTLTTTAEQATWSTTVPTGTITRIGFVYDATTTPIARGTTVSGFSFSLSPTSAFTGGQVATIAQLFGQTVGTTTLVYDESGDQSPSNFNDDGTPGDPTRPTTATGVANPTVDGIDSANNNTGTGVNGENNVFAISGASAVLVGPSGQPAAVGPNSNNDDFTNKSALVPANTAPGSTINPDAVGFTNTVQNNGTAILPAISLVPTAPTTATDLPTGTTVTITYGAASATYLYNSSGTGSFTWQSGTGTTATAPIQITNLAAGASANYGTEVNLPATTPLSTDATILRGFPVPVTAFVDGTTGTVGSPETGEPQNITIDRVYTGFLRLVKESRILQGTGPAVLGTDGTFSSSTTPKTPSPGNIIEYRITYTNISTPAGTSGNVVLNAGNVVITEDGVVGTNNWALDGDPSGTPGFGTIDTSNVVGSAIDSGGATITFFSGNPSTTTATDQTGTTAATDITKYVNTVTGTVTPGQIRTFQFQRKLN